MTKTKKTMSDAYTHVKILAVEKIISASLRKVLKAGLHLGQGAWELDINSPGTYPAIPIWTTRANKCCPFSAVLLIIQPSVAVTFNTDLNTKARASICAALSISYEFLSGMIQAYDSMDNVKITGQVYNTEHYSQGHTLGTKLGKKFLKKKENV